MIIGEKVEVRGDSREKSGREGAIKFRQQVVRYERQRGEVVKRRIYGTGEDESIGNLGQA